MRTTTNYGLNLAEGTDKYNHLTVDNPNYETIDGQMKTNEMNGTPSATELKSGSVHALTRSKPDASMFHFTATSNYTAGDTFTVDGVQVTALLPSGESLGSGAYIIGSEVLCCLRETLLTLFISSGTVAVAEDSEKLGGQLPEYYGTAEDVENANALATAANQISIANQQAISTINDEIEGLKKPSIVVGVEEVIGTLNGKNVYRKRLTESGFSRNTSFFIDTALNSTVVDTVLELKGNYRDTASFIPLNFTYTTSQLVYLELASNGLRLGVAGYTVTGYFVEIVYTKK